MRRPTDESQQPCAGGFHINMPVVAFEKADAPVGQQKRIAGIISTDNLDQQQERLVQDGLNFQPFLETGYFNDEHQNNTTTAIVGYPKTIQAYKKGDTLPDGQVASANLTWTEGFLCGRRGAEIWELANDLRGSGRTLGFSVEGKINTRKSTDEKVVTSADVTGVAVCSRPVNSDCRLVTLAKSLQSAAKAYTVGTVPAQSAAHPLPQPAPNTVRAGEGVGQLLTATFARNKKRLRKRAGKATPKPVVAARKAQRSPAVAKGVSPGSAAKGPNLLKKADALDWIRKAVPGVSDPTAEAFLCHAQRLLAQGLI